MDEGSDKTGAGCCPCTTGWTLPIAGRPVNAPAGTGPPSRRHVVEDFEMPRALPEALLEGLALRMRAATANASLSDVRHYSARVAACRGRDDVRPDAGP